MPQPEIVQYDATYRISSGVSKAGAASDCIEQTELVSATDPMNAMRAVMERAQQLAVYYLSHRDADKVTVTLLSLLGPDEEEVPFNAYEVVATRPSLAHILATPASPQPATSS